MRNDSDEADTLYQGWLDDQERKASALRAAALSALPTVLETLSAETRRVAKALATRPAARGRGRYCEMCDAWTGKRECPACGADTQPAMKGGR